MSINQREINAGEINAGEEPGEEPPALSGAGYGGGVMLQSRREILDEFLRSVDDYNDKEMRNLAELTLNSAYLDIWIRHPFNDHLLPSPIQLTTVAGSRDYVLPSYWGRLPERTDFIRNLTTGDKIRIVKKSALEQEHPDAGTDREVAGTPRFAFIHGMVGVRVQPTAGGQALEVVSSNALDTAIRVTIEGINANNDWDNLTVTLNGTTPVQLGTWKPPLTNFTKAYPEGIEPATELTSSRGTITLRLSNDGNILGQLLPEESAREFPSLILYPKPAASGQIIAVPAIRAPKRLLYDSDEIPRFWGSAIKERMRELWKVNTHGSEGGKCQGPSVMALVQHDNSIQSGPLRTRPFGY